MFERKVTPEIKAFIQENKQATAVSLVKTIAEKFGIELSPNTVIHHKGIYKRRKQPLPSMLLKPVGTERLDKDGYVRVIVAPGKERLKHHVVWEQAHEKVKRDEVLLFLDGDRTNCDIDNLMLMKRKYMGAYNEFKQNGIKDKELRKASLLSAILKVETTEIKYKHDLKVNPSRHSIKSTNWINIVRLHKEGMSNVDIAKTLKTHLANVQWTVRHYKLGLYN